MNLKEVSLNIELGDGGECAMLLIQPTVPLEAVAGQGFQIADTRKRTASLETVKAVCTYSRNSISQDYDHAHFLIMPELSLTRDGFNYIERYVQSKDCPNDTVIIAGLEGLTWDVFEELLDRSDNPKPCHKAPVGTVDWVNCSITLVKEHTGQVRLFVQSKFRASRFEQSRERILEGQDLLLFRLKTNANKDFSFVSLICSDFSAEDGGTTTINEALEGIKSQATNPVNLEFIIGLLHNRTLKADPFPMVIQNIFNRDHSELDLQDTAVVFVNGAKNPTEDGYGESSFFFHRTSWAIIGKDEAPSEWYNTAKWPGDCHHYRLMVDSPCVFTLQYLPIRKTGRNSGSMRLPFKGVSCHDILADGTLFKSEKRGLHIVCENLLAGSDSYSRNLSTAPGVVSLQERIRGHYKEYKRRLLSEKEVRLSQITKLLFSQHTPHVQNYYHWTEPVHGKPLVQTLHTMSLLRILGKELEFNSDTLAIAGISDEFYLAVLDGNDVANYGQMIEKYSRELEDQPLRTGSSLVILTRTEAVPPAWDKARPYSQEYVEHYSVASADVPDPDDAHFSPKEPLIGFFAHLQNWKVKGDEEQAITYLRGYLGQA